MVDFETPVICIKRDAQNLLRDEGINGENWICNLQLIILSACSVKYDGRLREPWDLSGNSLCFLNRCILCRSTIKHLVLKYLLFKICHSVALKAAQLFFIALFLVLNL